MTSKRLPSFLLGLTFVISGVVKGIDPMGLAYKLEEYLNAFGFSSLSAFNANIAVAMCGIEITLGLFLLLGRWRRAVAIVVMLFMGVFTVVTYEIYVNPYLGITECGCFGDAIELSNGATFWKNVVLMILAILNIIIAFRYDKAVKAKCVKVSILVLVISFSLPTYSYIFLPPFDFLGYNIGDSVIGNNRLLLYDEDFNDVTSERIAKGKSVYIITARHELTTKNRDLIDRLMNKAIKEDRKVIAISSNIKLIDNINMVTPYYTDDLVVKSIVRRDAGLVLVEDGIIRGKWSIDTEFCIFSANLQKIKIWLWGVFYLTLGFSLYYKTKSDEE